MIGTLRRELLDQLLIINEHHLRRTLTEYLQHYNAARPHRALGQLTPAHVGTRPPEPIDLADRQIRRKQVLGGLTHEYYIAALSPRAATEDAVHPLESYFRAPQDPHHDRGGNRGEMPGERRRRTGLLPGSSFP